MIIELTNKKDETKKGKRPGPKSEKLPKEYLIEPKRKNPLIDKKSSPAPKFFLDFICM